MLLNKCQSFNFCIISMLNSKICKFASKESRQILKFSVRAFSSKGKDPKTTEEILKVPASNTSINNDHANWELLGMRGYRFCLPGNVGLPPQRTSTSSYKKVQRPKRMPKYVKLPDTSFMRHMEIVTQLAALSGELSFTPSEPHTFFCQAMECPYLLREQVTALYPNANIGQGPLTAVCVALRYPPKNLEIDWKHLLFLFEETSRRMCSKLHHAGFWADFPSTESLCTDSATAEQVFARAEAEHSLGSPGMQVEHIAGCVLLMHAPFGDSKILGWLFTTAPFDDSKLVKVLSDENDFSA